MIIILIISTIIIIIIITTNTNNFQNFLNDRKTSTNSFDSLDLGSIGHHHQKFCHHYPSLINLISDWGQHSFQYHLILKFYLMFFFHWWMEFHCCCCSYESFLSLHEQWTFFWTVFVFFSHDSVLLYSLKQYTSIRFYNKIKTCVSRWNLTACCVVDLGIIKWWTIIRFLDWNNN